MPDESNVCSIKINIDNLPEFRKRIARAICAAAELYEALKDLNGVEIQLNTEGNLLKMEEKA